MAKMKKGGGKGGRPSEYREEYANEAYKLCLLGATDKALADFFGVAESTINKWKIDHKEFSESLKGGKDDADATVADSLFKRANGYEHNAVKIFADAKTGAEMAVSYVERYPPDTTAMIFWLKNRQPEKWRDRQEITGAGGGPVVTETTVKLKPDEAYLRMIHGGKSKKKVRAR